MFNLKRDIKDLKRLEKILEVFFEEGFGYYLSKSKLRSHLPFRKRIKPTFPTKSNNKQLQAIKLRRAFERLGPTFVKLGQLLSLRPDLVPPEFSKEFEKLQDHVPPFPFSQVKKIVEADFKKPLSKIFKDFDRKPCASASIAQVHKATLKSGQKVAVKVQRPKIKEIIDTDLDILFFIAYSLEKHFSQAHNYRPLAIVKEFALWTRKELNFEVEASNASRLKEEMKNNKQVFVPKVFQDYSSKRVLTLGFIEGVRIDNYAALKRYRLSPKKIAQTYFTSILEQALLYGLFHADPHPANIFIKKNGTLVYLDYGIMGENTVSDRRKVIRFINSIPAGNAEKSLDIILSLAREIKQKELTEFKQKALPILREAYSGQIKDKSVAKAMYKIIALGARHGIVFDPSHVLMAKAIYQAEGLGIKLDPNFKVKEGLETFAREYLKEKITPTKVIGRMKKTLSTHKDLLLDLPEHIINLIERLEEERPLPSCEKENLKELEEKFENSVKRRDLALMVLILFIASTFFFYLEGYQSFLGLPISFILITLTVILFFYFMFSKKKHNWRDEL